jgi:hypothetical protein
MTTKAPFVINPDLTAIAIAYRNPILIADLVLPRHPVGKQDYTWTKYNQENAYTVPNTLVGRKGQVNRVEFGGTAQTSSCLDYGLEDGIPHADINNAPKNYDPKGAATQTLQDLIALDREVRVSAKVLNAANYASAYKATLSGTDQWDDPASDPVELINAALDGPLIRPNTMTLGRSAWTALRSNSAIVKAANKNDGGKGNASKQAIMDLFELTAINVGEGFVNTAKKGQAVSMSRVWGKSCLLHYNNPVVGPQGGVTFGWTAQFGDKVAMEREDSDIGLRGGIAVRTGETVDEQIVCADVAYLFSAVIS